MEQRQKLEWTEDRRARMVLRVREAVRSAMFGPEHEHDYHTGLIAGVKMTLAEGGWSQQDWDELEREVMEGI